MISSKPLSPQITCLRSITFAALFLISSHSIGKDNALEANISAAQVSAERLQMQLNPSPQGTEQQSTVTTEPSDGNMKGMNQGVVRDTEMGKMKKKFSMNTMKQTMDKPMGCKRCRRMMGMMKGSTEGKLQVGLPAFPGNKHLYHIGSNGFFLDKAEIIDLTESQRQKLKQLQSNWQVADQQYGMDIELAEQELWQLTGGDAPDIQQIEAQVRKIGGIIVQQRLKFIQAVGEAATILSIEQRQLLTQVLQ